MWGGTTTASSDARRWTEHTHVWCTHVCALCASFVYWGKAKYVWSKTRRVEALYWKHSYVSVLYYNHQQRPTISTKTQLAAVALPASYISECAGCRQNATRRSIERRTPGPQHGTAPRPILVGHQSTQAPDSSTGESQSMDAGRFGVQAQLQNRGRTAIALASCPPAPPDGLIIVQNRV